MFFYNVNKMLKMYGLKRYSLNSSEQVLLLPKDGRGCCNRKYACIPKFFLIPQRYVLGLMGFLAIVNAYTMRVCLSVAITEMVIPTNSTKYDPNACPSDTSSSSNSSVIKDNLYDWSETTQSMILSSFYWGYVVTHIPGGVMAEKFGGKYTLGLGILSTSVFTMLIPLVVIISNGSVAWVTAFRVIIGFGEGTTFPALNALLAKWVPAEERSKLGTLVYAGAQIGTVVGNALSGILISATDDWASAFYFFGGMGVLWFILFSLLCYSNPQEHPFISDDEKNYLQKELSNVSNEKKVIPWKAILTSVPVWALVFTQVGHDWGFFTMVTDLPKYMKEVLKFNVKENGLWSALPYVVMWIVSMISGWLCDFVINRGYMGRGVARKFFTTIASIGPGVFIIIASYTGCDRMLAVAMFTVAMGLMGTFYCGMKVNGLDLTTNYAGTVMAIVNGLGAVSGIITPYIVGFLTEDHTQKEWRTVFWISLAVLAFTNLIFVIFGSGEEQWWNRPGATKKTEAAMEEGQHRKESEARQQELGWNVK